MAITFRYKSIKRPNGTEVKSPSIPVTLSGKGGKFDFIALLDSGADVSVLSKSIAELLGLNLSGKVEEASGIGGAVKATQTNLVLELEKGHEHYSINLPVKVILNEEQIPILLGREGFFDKFTIIFDQKQEKITLKKNQN